MPEPSKPYLIPHHRIKRRPCFKCGVEKPLSDYCNNNRKYKVAKYMDVSTNCRDCLIEFAQEDFKAVQWNEEESKYEVLTFASKEEIIDFYLNQ